MLCVYKRFVVQRGHTIKNKSVDVKKALSKNDMQQGGGPMGGGGGPMMGGRGGPRGGRGGRSKLKIDSPSFCFEN